jgi:hypothetical protein
MINELVNWIGAKERLGDMIVALDGLLLILLCHSSGN